MRRSAASRQYRVEVTDAAQEEMPVAFDWIAAEASLETAERWFGQIESSLERLETMPRRCAAAPESDYFQRDLRQQLFGRKHGTYRLIFGIDDTERCVTILHFRNAAMRWIGSEPNQPEDHA